MSAVVGQLACQTNPLLRRLTATVVSCAPAAERARPSGDLSKAAPPGDAAPVFDLVLSDSVLFPEGGGQPWDGGTVGGHPVLAVVRRGDTCVIQTPHRFAAGEAVEASVDWPRRRDHAQHHTAQHLLTAILQRELGLPTAAWSLSHPHCHVLLPTARIDDDSVRRVEDLCAAEIAKATPVVCATYASRAELPEARSRAVPADVAGPIRVVAIDGVDACTCCGTHTATLADVGPLLLLHQESKGRTVRLFFVAGDRARALAAATFARERALARELGTAAAELLPTVVRRARAAADAAKARRRLLTELARLTAATVCGEVEAAAAATPEGSGEDGGGGPFFFQYDDADADFLATVGAALGAGPGTRAALCVLGAGSARDAAPGAGQLLVVCGDPARAEAFAGRFLPLVDGKGGPSRAGYRGKCTMSKWAKAVKEVTELPL